MVFEIPYLINGLCAPYETRETFMGNYIKGDQGNIACQIAVAETTRALLIWHIQQLQSSS